MLATICKGPHFETYIKQINKKNPQHSAEKKLFINTQIEDSNGRKCPKLLKEDHENKIFSLSLEFDLTGYRRNLARIFGEEFMPQAPKNNKSLWSIIKIKKDRF